MLVRELIKQLLEVDLDAEVMIRTHADAGRWDGKEIDGLSGYELRPGVVLIEPRGAVYF